MKICAAEFVPSIENKPPIIVEETVEARTMHVYDSVEVLAWNTDHTGKEGPNTLVKNIRYKNERTGKNDTYVTRTDNTEVNSYQGDYPIASIDLYYWDYSKFGKFTGEADLQKRGELVASLTEEDIKYDIEGKRWNISVYKVFKGRNL